MVYEVCLLSFEYPPNISGGLGTFTKKLEKKLVEKGTRVNVFLPSFGLHLKRRTKLVDCFKIKVGKREEEFQVHLMKGETGNKNIYLFSAKKKSSKFNDKRLYYWKGIKTAVFARYFFEYYQKNLVNKKVVIHANDWHSGLAGALIRSHYPRVPLLYTVHLIHPGGKSGRVMRYGLVRSYGIDNYLSPSVMEKFKIRKWIKVKKSRKRKKKLINYGYWLEPIIASYASKVNTVSRGFLDEAVLPSFRKFNLPKKRFTYVFNGLDIDEMIDLNLKEKNSVRKILLKTLKMDDGVMFLNLGRQNTSQKATDILVAAITYLMEKSPRKMKDARFIILVAEGRKSSKEVHDLLGGLQKKYKDNVRIITEWVKHIGPYYKAADYFIFPSRFEPFGFTQLEAMCKGTPVIGSRTSGIRDVQVDIYEKKDHAFGKFNKPTGVLFANNSSRSLANSISKMHDLFKNDPKEYRKLQKNSIKRSKYFTIDKTVDAYLKIYNELLGSA